MKHKNCIRDVREIVFCTKKKKVVCNQKKSSATSAAKKRIFPIHFRITCTSRVSAEVRGDV